MNDISLLSRGKASSLQALFIRINVARCLLQIKASLARVSRKLINVFKRNRHAALPSKSMRGSTAT